MALHLDISPKNSKEKVLHLDFSPYLTKIWPKSQQSHR